MRARHALLCFALLFTVGQARADTDWVSVIWHNDVFLNKDGGGYTNGLYASWYDVSDTEPEEFDAPWLTRPLMGWLIDDEGEDFAVSSHTIGQAMMTPKDIKESVPDPDDAPYAGLLFWRSGYIRMEGNQADKVSVTLGIVGPSSRAEEVQRFVHKVVGANEPKGWDYQIKDEPVGQIRRARVWRYNAELEGLPEADLLLVGEGAVGNLETSAGVSVMARFGTRLKRSFGTASQTIGRVSSPMAIGRGWNIYVGAGASLVYNQIFISGSGLRSGPEADLRREQFAGFAGFSYSWDNLSLTGSFVSNTPLDENSTARQRFGTLTIAWRL